MSLRTNLVVIGLRNVARKIGVNGVIQSIFKPRNYEERFHERLFSFIRSGDCVWDVGANVGHYCRKFSESAGAGGKVVAFEPSPINFKTLEANLADLANVVLCQFALSNVNGRFGFRQGDDALGATSRLDAIEAAKGSVEIRRADALIDKGDLPIPHVIKIDVEGFEWEVLCGMSRLLPQQQLRVVAVEVHFGLLAARGMAQAPRDIEKLLRGAGFSYFWTDASHLIATRSA